MVILTTFQNRLTIKLKINISMIVLIYKNILIIGKYKVTDIN